MVVVDRFTKMAHFIGLETNASARDVVDTFLKEVWKLHALPWEIISDMDAQFSGEFWESLCKSLGIERKMSPFITRKRTDKRKEPTKYWKVTSATSSTTTKTTVINCYH